MKHWLIVILLILAASIAAAAQPEGSGAIVAVEEGAGKAREATAGTVKEGSNKSGGYTAKNTSSNKTVTSKKTTKAVVNHPSPPPPPSSSSAKYNGDIIGDKYSFLNFEVIDKVQPVWTNANKAAGAKGLVQVEILVEKDGRVLTAHARTGNPLLWPEAERAALETRLNSPTFNNRPVRAMGFLVYRFGPPDDDD